ncbi:MAG: hypothetical protein HDQ91_05425, partial [Desulfovibrio sp.]|nr:hypothetical protein [Desulfovibrio sp.]
MTKMKIAAGFIALFWLCILACPKEGQAADSLGNIADFIREQQGPQSFGPGTWIILPDGTRSQILSEEPEGYRTDTGVLLTPEGVILEGEHRGELVKPEIAETQEPEKAVIKPEPEKAAQPGKPEQKQAESPARPGIVELREKQKPESQPQKQEELTLAQMLPVTELPEAKKPALEKPKLPEKKEPEKKTPEKKTPEKKAHSSAPEKKAAPAKPKPGQELRIPPEAAKTGNLSFLEGCWQGTRPEYFSKRTIRECFCFGANGKTGKRRVIDPSYNRMCIGSTHATLSANGVLSVSSSGAACNDGERWGQAEMVCRNSGPKTPCSWVFRDAQNGRQSYQI